MENQPWVFCDRMETHTAHGPTCPGTGNCGSRDTHEPHLVLTGSLAPFWCFGMRIRLYREKHVTTDRRQLLDTTWADEPLPVLVSNDQTGHDGAMIVGTLTAIRRDVETGWVTGLVETGRLNPTGLHAEADFDSIGDPEEVGDVLVMVGARLRAVTLGDRPTWHEMRIP
jgi:hypothetical protein